MTQLIFSPFWIVLMSLMICISIGTIITTKSKKYAMLSKISGSFCFGSLLISAGLQLNLL